MDIFCFQFDCGYSAIKMPGERFSSAELTDIHFIYGLAGGNAYAAVRLYQERFPDRRIPDSHAFIKGCAKMGLFMLQIMMPEGTET